MYTHGKTESFGYDISLSLCLSGVAAVDQTGLVGLVDYPDDEDEEGDNDDEEEDDLAPRKRPRLGS